MQGNSEPLVGRTRALAHSLAHALDAGDWEAVRTVCAPDIVLVADVTLRGVDDFIGFLAHTNRHFPGLRVERHEWASSAEHVVWENRYIAPPGADWRLDGRSCSVLVVRDGQIAEIREFYVPSPDDRIGGGGIFAPDRPSSLPHRTHPPMAVKLADEQAALRRVSSLVARASEPDEVFAAIGREIGLLMKVDATSLCQFVDDETVRLVSRWNRHGTTHPASGRNLVDSRVLELRRTVVPVHFDNLAENSPLLDMARDFGVETVVALPLLVDDDVWGVVFAHSRTRDSLPAGAEQYAMRFTSLAETALAHSRVRDSLSRSRARVLAAADAARRQVGEDLHAGAQQRLGRAIVELGLALEAAGSHQCAAAEPIAEAMSQTEQASTELHDLVRGILPAALTRHGLRAAIESLIAHLPLQVAVQVDDRRLPASVETTAYFVIAEALTNVIKHARIDHAQVTAGLREGELVIEVRDDGVGGATDDTGTGLSGLADRVEANDGTLRVHSPAGGGTTVRARIPVTAD